MKAEIVFGLDNAGWPAILVDSTGKIQRANQSCVQALGSLKEGSDYLSTIWSPENITPVSEFLETVEYSISRNSLLKFKTREGSTVSYLVYVAPIMKGDTKLFIFQLFKPPAATAA